MINNLKKLLSLFAICFLVFACAKENDRTINPQTVQAQGGVDVGNMSSSAIPFTNASLTYPGNWTAKTVEKILTLTNISSSTIKASRAEFTDLITSTQLGLKQYLETKYPGRTYEFYEINGLSGVRAEIESSETSKKIDIYLMSELQDLIHIYGDLNKADNGVSDGENIVSTVRVKYQGTPVENAIPKTVTLYRDVYYSFLGECYSTQPGCNDAMVGYGMNISKTGLGIGIGGFNQRGRIIELGSESEIPFSEIKIEGEYIVSPKSKIPISDVYTTFTPEAQNVEKRVADLKNDHIYLIRTIKWPTEDLVLKMKVNSFDGSTVSVAFEKLAAVNPQVLQQQVDAINKNTLENELPMKTGEITLYNHSIWKNIVYSSFNFEYSTILNRFITNNSWDLEFNNGCDKKPTLYPPPFTDSIARLIPLQSKSLEQVTKENLLLENPDTESPCSGLIEIGKTYGILHHRGGVTPATIYGAVQVLDLDKNGSWVRLKFRRIAIEKPKRFQVWKQRSVFFEKEKIELSNKEHFFIHDFLRRKKYETVSIESTQDTSKLVISSCMYENDCGFFNFGKNVDLDKLTIKDLEDKKGLFRSSTEFTDGDVIGVYSENYKSKVIMAFRVEDHLPGKSTKLDTRYLYYAISEKK